MSPKSFTNSAGSPDSVGMISPFPELYCRSPFESNRQASNGDDAVQVDTQGLVMNWGMKRDLKQGEQGVALPEGQKCVSDGD